MFFIGLTILSNFTNANLLNAIPLSCISMNNQECKTRPQVINVDEDETVFFPFSIGTSKCSGSCNNINYPYAKICVPDVVKNLIVKVFNLMWKTIETRYTEWHETCKCECKFGLMFVIIKNVGIKINADVNNELIDKGVCDKEFIFNPSNCECECDVIKRVTLVNI